MEQFRKTFFCSCCHYPVQGISAKVSGRSEKTRWFMQRTAHPALTPPEQEALASYEHRLREWEDLAVASIRNYLSDLRHFIACYETERDAPVHASFTPQGITTPAFTRYRTYLQTVQTNKGLSERALDYIVKKYVHFAQLPDVSPHDLRHRFGYRIAQIMGYDSLDTTKLYIQGTEQDLQQAVETIAWTLENPCGGVVLAIVPTADQQEASRVRIIDDAAAHVFTADSVGTGYPSRSARPSTSAADPVVGTRARTCAAYHPAAPARDTPAHAYRTWRDRQNVPGACSGA